MGAKLALGIGAATLVGMGVGIAALARSKAKNSAPDAPTPIRASDAEHAYKLEFWPDAKVEMPKGERGEPLKTWHFRDLASSMRERDRLVRSLDATFGKGLLVQTDIASGSEAVWMIVPPP